jgi:hypothetical protein
LGSDPKATGAGMFGKGRYLLLMLAMTTVGPYLLSTTAALKNVGSLLRRRSADDPAVATADTGAGAAAAADAVTAKPAAQSRAPIVHPMEDALRLDVTTDWVMTNWPRVSAGLAELDLQGYRVPLVSGTTEADVAGSLTYYFNAKQRLERITFFGTTGDAGKLVALLEARFAFKRSDTKEPNLFLYQVKSWGKVQSELRIRPSPVVRKDVPNSRYEVALLIDRPKSMKWVSRAD